MPRQKESKLRDRLIGGLGLVSIAGFIVSSSVPEVGYFTNIDTETLGKIYVNGMVYSASTAIIAAGISLTRRKSYSASTENNLG